MASHVFNAAKTRFWNGGIDLDTDDIRVALLMTNTTADTENDAKVFISDITTLDEFNGANYARTALASEQVTTDDGNDRSEFAASSITLASLGAGTRSINGALIYKHVGADSANILIAWIEFSATPDGNNFIVNWDSISGIGDILRMA